MRVPGRRARLVLGFLVVFLVLPLAFVVYQAVSTLRLLTQVEAERDTWQRPQDVIAALAIAPGSVVGDLGSGSGYFALRLSRVVGSSGQVLATDLRALSLSFLWLRALGLPDRNVQVIRAEVDDPHLPAGLADAVLVANTYHELADAPRILEAVFLSLKPGGRLVVLDRGPRVALEQSAERLAGHHELRLTDAEEQTRRAGFRTLFRDEVFIDQPGQDDIWWLLVSNRP